MKRRSDKTAAIYKIWVPRRIDFVSRGGCCLCGAAADDCHEIIGGSHRMNAFVERCCWLRVSRQYHDELQGMATVDQLALKLLTDPEHFDLVRFHEVWGRPQTAITPAEVLEAIRRKVIREQRNTWY